MNEEYLSYYDYLKSINFENILENLKNKYKNQKVILFGMGALLDVIIDEFHIQDFLNIIGITDSHIEHENENEVENSDKEYKGIRVFNPLALRSINYNVILDTTTMLGKTKQFLRKNYYVKKNTVIKNLIQIPILQIIKSFIHRQKVLFNYIKESKNIIKSVYYGITCNKEELISKTNYIKKLRILQEKNDKIRVAFLCSDIKNTDFITLYNLMKFDNKFNVYPVILIPNNLIETKEIDEELMKNSLSQFKNSNDIDIIDGWDRDTNDLACLHAFKPDIVFYQDPIYIKDNFSPLKMSETALTFNIQYDFDKKSYNKICSGYYKKQAANFWKIFVKSEEDEKEFITCTNLLGKDIVTNTNGKPHLKILEYLKSL